MWLFLATEVMFFTGLIGSYIVLRSGSPSTVLQQPLPPDDQPQGRRAHLRRAAQVGRVESRARPRGSSGRRIPSSTRTEAHEIVDRGPRGHDRQPPDQGEGRRGCTTQLHDLGAEAKVEPLVIHNWPKPYDELTNPLSINLTAFNTFILICSSVTMVLALSAIQQGKRGNGA